MNAILDNYSHTLLAQKRNNRERILELINKTEDDVKNGLSVNEMMPFFEHFSIPLRVYDCMGTSLVRYDPEKAKSSFQSNVLPSEERPHLFAKQRRVVKAQGRKATDREAEDKQKLPHEGQVRGEEIQND